MANTHRTVMVIHRNGKTEVLGRPGHIDLRTALDVAHAAEGSLVSLRHTRIAAAKHKPEMVRIIQGEPGDPRVGKK